MNQIRLAVAAFLLLPTLATAQRRGMGGAKETNWDSVASKRAPSGPTITSKDFDEVSPFKFLLEKKKDLKLTEPQMTSLKGADATLRDSNKNRFSLIDSLKKESRPKTSGTPSAENEARMVIANDQLQIVVHEVQESYDAAAKLSLPMLDESQRADGQKMLDRYNDAMRAMLREKMGSGVGPGAAGGRGGRGRGGA